MKKLFRLAALVPLLALASCSDYKFVEVSGVVTLNGKALPNAYVMFQPIGADPGTDPGPGSTGKTDENGRYTLHSQLNPDQPGAVLGQHKVLISCFDGTVGGTDDEEIDADPDAGNTKKKSNVPVIPKEYNDESKLTITLTGSTTEANFDIVIPDKKKK